MWLADERRLLRVDITRAGDRRAATSRRARSGRRSRRRPGRLRAPGRGRALVAGIGRDARTILREGSRAAAARRGRAGCSSTTASTTRRATPADGCGRARCRRAREAGAAALYRVTPEGDGHRGHPRRHDLERAGLGPRRDAALLHRLADAAHRRDRLRSRSRPARHAPDVRGDRRSATDYRTGSASTPRAACGWRCSAAARSGATARTAGWTSRFACR